MKGAMTSRTSGSNCLYFRAEPLVPEQNNTDIHVALTETIPICVFQEKEETHWLAHVVDIRTDLQEFSLSLSPSGGEEGPQKSQEENPDCER